jgi:hypothetical protein
VRSITRPARVSGGRPRRGPAPNRVHAYPPVMSGAACHRTSASRRERALGGGAARRRPHQCARPRPSLLSGACSPWHRWPSHARGGRAAAGAGGGRQPSQPACVVERPVGWPGARSAPTSVAVATTVEARQLVHQARRAALVIDVVRCLLATHATTAHDPLATGSRHAAAPVRARAVRAAGRARRWGTAPAPCRGRPRGHRRRRAARGACRPSRAAARARRGGGRRFAAELGLPLEDVLAPAWPRDDGTTGDEHGATVPAES